MGSIRSLDGKMGGEDLLMGAAYNQMLLLEYKTHRDGQMSIGEALRLIQRAQCLRGLAFSVKG